MSNLQEENLINLNKHNKMKEENKKLTERSVLNSYKILRNMLTKTCLFFPHNWHTVEVVS